MEKELILTQIKAIFTKDFETFGKMDPYVNFRIGKSEAETETAEGGGKQPTWSATLKFQYYDETVINVKAFERDLTSSEFMGEGKIDVNTLKNNGALEINISGEGQQIGKVFCNYALKTLPPTPLLTIKNIRCDFYKQTKFMLKTKPYFILSCGSNSMATEVKEEGDPKALSWNETLRIKLNEKDIISFTVEDKDDGSKIFGYTASVSQFRTLKGCKSFCVIDKTFQPLGILEFQYETKHLVEKEESDQNEELEKKETNQLTMITIQKIQGRVKGESEDIYFKINLGPNMIKTTPIQNAKKDFVIQLNKCFYAENKENKIIFAAYDKDLVSDDILGSGELLLQQLSSGEKVVKLDKGEVDFGEIILTIKTKKVISKSITIKNLKVKLASSGDLFGGSQPYIIGRIGGWSNRTQTGNGQQVSFKKSLEMKFSEEKELTLEVWQEDINEHDKLFEEKISIENLNPKGQVTLTLKSDEKKKEGSISFKYQTKNVQQEKKPEPPKSVTPQKPKVNSNKNSEKENEKKNSIIKSEKTEERKLSVEKNQKAKQIITESQGENMDDRYQSIRNESLNRSKNTFRLPSISDPHNYGDKIFDKQSSATLQKSILVYSIPKASRFGSGPKYSGEPSYYIDTCFKPQSGRGVGFGYGNKRQFPDWLQRNMKQNPAPGAYFDHHHSTSTDFRPKGPTFGISYKFYEKVTIPKEKRLPTTSQRLKPIKQLK